MGKLGVISVDGHAKASRATYRNYVSSAYHEAFDGWLQRMDGMPDAGNKSPKLPDESQWDTALRQRDLEAHGVVGEVIFANGLPFATLAFQDAANAADRELAREGRWAHNRWLVDFCNELPGRRAGMAVTSFDDIDEAVGDVHWAADHGLKGIMLPALGPSRFFFDPVLDPIWRACEETGMVLNQHGGTGMPAYNVPGVATIMAIALEQSFYSGQSMWQLMIGGVFERFPRLQYVLTETMADWISGKLRFMDGLASKSDWMEFARFLGREPTMTRLPSEYWAQNCWAGSSPPARSEFEMRHELAGKLMFGVDYPHFETIWPAVENSIQGIFGYLQVPEDEARKILMGNAVDVFGFDVEALEEVIERVGLDAEVVLQPRAEDAGDEVVVGYNRAGYAPLSPATVPVGAGLAT